MVILFSFEVDFKTNSLSSKNNSLYSRFKKEKISSSFTKNEWVEIITHLEDKISCLEEINHTASESHSKYKSLFEMSDDALLVIENFTFVDCNYSAVKMLGYNSKEEFLNTHPSALSPIKQPDGKLSYIKAQEMIILALKNGSHHFEWVHTRANGENFPIEVWLSKVEFDGRTILNTIWRDLTEKKKAEQLILKNIEEKEILLKEIHHRVKNNLQIISSLLNLQANMLTDENVKSVLFQSKFRIESMCKVHEMLYSSKNFSSINYKDYLADLIDALLQNASTNGAKIVFELKIKKLILNINTAVPLGLIINELVTNSLKHAFPTQKNGLIFIQITSIKNNQLKLIYKDDGVGYSSETTFQNAQGLGFQLISSLAEQLNGEINRKLVKQGTHYQLVFDRL